MKAWRAGGGIGEIGGWLRRDAAAGRVGRQGAGKAKRPGGGPGRFGVLREWMAGRRQVGLTAAWWDATSL